MRTSSYEFRRLAAGYAAIRTSPQDREELERISGITELRARIGAERAARPQPLSFLYLVDTHTETGHRYYKIGKSIQPHIRLRELQSGKGAKMPPDWSANVVRPFALRIGDLAVESSIHRDLRQYRVPRTEWFAADLAVSQYIVGQDAWDVWKGERPDGYEAPQQTVA